MNVSHGGLIKEIRSCLADHRRRRRLTVIASILSVCVVFSVCAALLRPAISVENDTATGDQVQSETPEVSTGGSSTTDATTTDSTTAGTSTSTTDSSSSTTTPVSTSDATSGTATDSTTDVADSNATSATTTSASSVATTTSTAASAASDTVLSAQGTATSYAETYENILGNGVYFGITANTWNQVEAETNAAVKVLNASQQSGNDLTNKSNQPWVIGQVKGSFKIKGIDADVWCRAEDASKISAGDSTVINYNYCDEASLDTYVDDIIGNATTYSTSMAAKSSFSPTDSTYVTTTSNTVTVDITSLGAGTYHLNLDDIYKNPTTGGLTIKKNTDQTIVFNYTGTSVTLAKFICVNGGTKYASDVTQGNETTTVDEIADVASTVIWNMPNATTVIIDSSIAGVVLAPKATVNVNSTSCGWIVADTVTNKGEWHNVWQKMDKNYKKPGSSGFVAYKTVDGETPTSSQVFDFDLAEKGSDGTWSIIQTKQNSGTKVTFDDISYTAEGTHYYRISEKKGNEGYLDNDTVYYIKTVVTSTTVSNTTYYSASSTYYSDEACTVPISAVTFDNTTSTSVPVTKVWDDSGNHDGIRPTSVTVHLLADGVDTGKILTLNDANSWEGTFSGLVAKSNGAPITYTISEDTVAGYKAAITGDATDGFTVTNSHSVTTTAVTVNKAWSGNTSTTPVKVDLCRSKTNNYSTETPTSDTHTVSFSNDGGPTYTVADGSAAIITITSSGSPNWSSLPSSATYTMGSSSGDVTVSGPSYDWNSRNWTVSYEVSDITSNVVITLDTSDLWWGFSFDGKQVSCKVVAGSSSGSSSGTGSSTTSSVVTLPSDAELVDTQTLTEAGGWTHTWTGLDKTYTYYVVEEVPDGYIATYAYTIETTSRAMTTTTITNYAPYSLPYTGGGGTRILYLLGGGLIVMGLAGLILARKRKGSAGGGGLRC